jgi:hypothetical protein
MQDRAVAKPKLQLIQSPVTFDEPPSTSPQLEAEIDETLVESFPASDPAPWWAGPPHAA